MKKWYVAHTQQRSEERARINLERQGFATYLPRYRCERRRARCREIVKAPLFPGYIFVQFDLEQARWRSINGTLGVRHLICDGERPAELPQRVVDALMARENEDGVIVLQPRPFQQGETLRIVSGALADCLGVFEGMADRDRVILLLDLLGRKVRVQAPSDQVAIAS